MSQANLVGPSDAGDDSIQMAKVGDKTKRNEDCPCNSGKKFKKCCLIQPDSKQSDNKQQDHKDSKDTTEN